MFKKTILLIGIVFILAGCKTTDLPRGLSGIDTPTAPAQETPVTLTGTIQPLQVSLYQKGTHLLTAEDSTKVTIASPTVNLGQYLDRKVTVEGVYEAGTTADEKVLIISSARFADENTAELKEYESRMLRIQFKYPDNLALAEEGNVVRLKKDSADVIVAEWFSTKDALADFIKTREAEDGTEISVAGRTGLRFPPGDKIRIYAAAPEGITLFSFAAPDAVSAETDRQVFYALLESVIFSQTAAPTGSECGGAENKACETGFRCELESGDKDAKGVCVDMNNKAASSACPFIAPPSNCKDYKIQNSNPDGCPASYECLDTTAEQQTGEIKLTPSRDQMNTPSLNPVLSEAEGLERGAGGELTPPDKGDSSSTPPDKGDTGGLTKQTETTSGDLSRSYENTVKNFRISYHKNWYFKSFGSTDDALWLVGFADKELDEPVDALIVLKILTGSEEGRRGKTEGGVYSFLLPRDAESHFALEGPASFQSLIEEMAQSLI